MENMALIAEIRTQIRQFGDELTETVRDARQYFRERKIFRWFAAVWILLCYGSRLLQWEVFIDSDIMLQAPEELLFSWYGSHRFGLILTKKLFSFVRLVPQFEMIMTMLALWCFVMLLDYCIHIWGRRPAKDGTGYVIAAVFLSAPVLAEQYRFILQAFEITMAMIYSVLAVFCAEQAVMRGKSRCWYLVSFGFMVWAFGSYAAFPAFYIALVLISYILVMVYGEERCGFSQGLIHAGHFLLGFVLFWVFSEILCRWKGADATYVMSMFQWGKKSAAEVSESLISDMRRIYLAEWRTFFHPLYSWIALIVSVWTVCRGWKKRKGSWPSVFCLLLAEVLLFLSPAFITFITAMNQPIRGQLTYALTFAFYTGALYLLVRDALMEEAETGKRRKSLKTAVFAASVLVLAGIAWRQSVTMNQLWETIYETYQSDKLMANRVYSEICRVANRSDMDNCKVVFVGTRDAKLTGRPLPGDVIGCSYFDYAYTNYVGITPRARNFFLILGMRMGMPNADDYAKASAACAGKDSWPSNESVFLLDGMVVVKLSDP